MKSPRSLPVLMPVVPGQRWSCHSCGDCCRTLVGHLTIEEKERIEEQHWEKELGVPPVIRAGRQWVLNKRADEACVFLDENNRCKIHARFGAAAKPLACRIFPFSGRPTAEGVQVSLRFDCPSVTSSLGEAIQNHSELIGELFKHLSLSTSGELIRLKGRLVATSEEIDGVLGRLVEWISQSALPFNVRIQVLARLVSMLNQGKLRKVRGPRLLELIDLLLGALPSELARTPPEAPGARQRAMLRQFVFACCEHVSLKELTGGMMSKLSTRRRQVAKAKRYLLGEGAIPEVRGIVGTATFEQAARVRPITQSAGEIDDLLTRYVLARLTGRSVFGEGYYGWPIMPGLGALCLSVAAIGWVARHHATATSRDCLAFDDVARAVGIVDRAATRVPVLGQFSERARLAYLMRDDALPRLLAECAMTETNG